MNKWKVGPVQRRLADSPVRRSLVVSSVTTVGTLDMISAVSDNPVGICQTEVHAVKGRTELVGARSSLRF
ncbi:hypothetical protein CsSME_00019033 [Camellia sinensis var. sinensis]